jgi:ERF superfamily
MEDMITAPGATPKLNAALAKFQAQVPKITKDEQANVGTYRYSYADLTAISAEALPLLGKLGLAFSAWPTLVDGKFVLLYELLHESGEQKSGIFPLASSGKPQELGGLITYYRRYALCAVTGIAPGGEDNDAQTANHEQQFDRPHSAAGAFESATPAPARQQERPPRQPAMSDDAKAEWGTRVDDIKTDEEGGALDAEVKAEMKAGRMNPTAGNAVLAAIRIKRGSLTTNGAVRAGATS